MANKYQLVTVLNPAIGDEALAALTENIKSKIEKSATIEAMDDLGKKKLAYEIDDQKEGQYIKVIFNAEPDFPKEIERVLKITEGVLRFLIVRVIE